MYIKLYEDFEYINRDSALVSSINDIFIECIDMGMLIRVQDRWDNNSIVVIVESDINFDCSDIKDSVYMLVDYLSSRFKVNSVNFDFFIEDIERDNPLATDSICFQVYKQGTSAHLNTRIFPDKVIVNSIMVGVEIGDFTLESKSQVYTYKDPRSKIESDIKDIFVELNDLGLSYFIGFTRSDCLEISIFSKFTLADQHLSSKRTSIDLESIRDMVLMMTSYLTMLTEFYQVYEASISLFKFDSWLGSLSKIGTGFPDNLYSLIGESDMEKFRERYGSGVSYNLDKIKMEILLE